MKSDRIIMEQSSKLDFWEAETRKMNYELELWTILGFKIIWTYYPKIITILPLPKKEDISGFW